MRIMPTHYPREQSRRDGQAFVRSIEIAFVLGALMAISAWALTYGRP